MTCIHHYQIQSIFNVLKVFCIPHIYLLHSQPLEFTYLFFFPVSMVLPVLGNVKVGVMYMSSFPIGILHVVINIQVLCGLRACFSLVLNNTPLSRYTRVHLSIHLLKDILMASIFRHMNKTAINIHVQVLVWT